MTDLKNTAAHIALAAMLAVAPMAAFADPESGSPAQSVDADPDEEAAEENVTAKGSLIENDAKADDGMSDDEETDAEGSLEEDSAKADD